MPENRKISKHNRKTASINYFDGTFHGIEKKLSSFFRPMSSAGVRLAPLMQKRPSDVSNPRQAKISEHEQAMQQPPPRSLSLENGQLFMEAQAARQQV